MPRPSGRHLFSAVLAVLSGSLWARSRATLDMFVLFVGGDGRAQVLASGGGRVCVALTNVRFGPERAWTAAHETAKSEGFGDELASMLDVTRIQIYPPADPAKVAAGGSPFGDGYLGFTFGSSQSEFIPAVSGSKMVYAVVPHWAIALPLLAWGLWRAFGPAAERHRRLRKGQCVNCGYDLRASSGQCPECGAAIDGDAVAAP